MFCNFCGKNFDPSEGFEEVSKSGHHMVKCEKCVYNQSEREYDWQLEMYGPDGAPVSSGRSVHKASRK
jgi:hypothetical protein